MQATRQSYATAKCRIFLLFAQCAHAHQCQLPESGRIWAADTVEGLSHRSECSVSVLRHSNVAVTQKCYIKTLPEQTVASMRRLEAALNEASTTVQ
jgi:hypothetical protein